MLKKRTLIDKSKEKIEADGWVYFIYRNPKIGYSRLVKARPDCSERRSVTPTEKSWSSICNLEIKDGWVYFDAIEKQDFHRYEVKYKVTTDGEELTELDRREIEMEV